MTVVEYLTALSAQVSALMQAQNTTEQTQQQLAQIAADVDALKAAIGDVSTLPPITPP